MYEADCDSSVGVIRAQFAVHLVSVVDLHAHIYAKCRLICRAISLIHRHSKDIGSMWAHAERRN